MTSSNLTLNSGSFEMVIGPSRTAVAVQPMGEGSLNFEIVEWHSRASRALTKTEIVTMIEGLQKALAATNDKEFFEVLDDSNPDSLDISSTDAGVELNLFSEAHFSTASLKKEETEALIEAMKTLSN